MTDQKIDLKKIKEYFGMTLPEMKREWVPLPEADKAQIWQGIQDGSLTY